MAERISPVRGSIGAQLIGGAFGYRASQGTAQPRGTVAKPKPAQPHPIPGSIALKRGAARPS